MGVQPLGLLATQDQNLSKTISRMSRHSKARTYGMGSRCWIGARRRGGRSTGIVSLPWGEDGRRFAVLCAACRASAKSDVYLFREVLRLNRRRNIRESAEPTVSGQTESHDDAVHH
jgi:hypothetical protein